MLKDSTIAIYVILDDILKTISYQEDKQRRINDSLILTTVLISARYFGGNMSKTLGYIKSHHCHNMLDVSRFNRRMHACSDLMEQVFMLLGMVFKADNAFNYFILDTFPVGVCHNIRIKRCRLISFNNHPIEDYRGKNASKRIYFYGFKIAVLTTEEGIPVEIAFISASFSDYSALHRLAFNLPAGSRVFGDSGFSDFMAQEEQFFMMITRKKALIEVMIFKVMLLKNSLDVKLKPVLVRLLLNLLRKFMQLLSTGFNLKFLLLLSLLLSANSFEFKVAT